MHIASSETFTDSHTHTLQHHRSTAIASADFNVSLLHFYFKSSSSTNPSDTASVNQHSQTLHANISTARSHQHIHSTLVFTYISVLRSQRFSFLHPLGEHDLTAWHIQPSFRQHAIFRRQDINRHLREPMTSDQMEEFGLWLDLLQYAPPPVWNALVLLKEQSHLNATSL